MNEKRKIDDGGPAFPQDYEQTPTNGEGMSLRDYFAAHAPAEAPDWFRHFDGSTPPAEPSAPGFTGPEIQHARWMASEGYGETDLAEADRRLWPLVEQFKAYYEARSMFQQARASSKYAAWRWAYADLMIETRRK